MNENGQAYNSLYELFTDAFRKWGKRPLCRYIDGHQSYSYQSFESQVSYTVSLLNHNGVGSGERVAILSENMPNWGVVFCSTVMTGRVAVPIFHGSSSAGIINILVHSGATALFVSSKLKDKVPSQAMDSLALVVQLEDFSIISGQPIPLTVKPETGPGPGPDSVAVIVYTSGTTSNRSKGVMLSHRNLCHCVWATYKVQPVNQADRWLSILPLAHVYEQTLGFLLPISVGGSIVYLQRAPTPSVLIPAMKKVRPTMMLAVPLIIEKIYKRIDQWAQSHRFPFLVNAFIGLRLRAEMGWRLKFVGIGGARMIPEIETFLRRVHFPYTIVYGMTETAPLICMSPVGENRVGFVGAPILGMQVRLGPADSMTGESEILVKGPNVMLGYYKDSEQTAAIIDSDGWLHTGDIGIRDEKGQYAVVGRSKNVILGSSGVNIYPEDIELVINSFPGVSESLVVPRGNRLVALVYLDESSTPPSEPEIIDYVNQRVNSASAISSIEYVEEPFQRSVTEKIRRFLYQ